MTTCLRALVLSAAALASSCANGESTGHRDGGGPGVDAPRIGGDVGGTHARGGTDAPAVDAHGTDAATADGGRTDAAGPTDAGRADAGRTDSGVDSGSSGGLDPRLDTPPTSAPTCSTPGGFCTAPGGPGVCRFYSATEGRCESCTSCGNLGASCADGTECDILFACFEGVCTNICPLGTFYCGPIDDCLDVGHPTHGVCRP